jgi:hypothetical protein
MQLSTLLETLLNGFYSGALASVLCLLYKEHGLLNISGAGWACLGSWLAATLALGKAPFADHGRIWLGVLLVGTWSLQAGFLYWRSFVFTRHPSLYLFLGLACHVAISVGGGNTIPASISTTLPDGVLSRTRLGAYEDLVLATVCVLVTTFMSLVVRSSAFCRHTLAYRSYVARHNTGRPNSPSDQRVRFYLCTTLLTQLVLLMILGMFAIPTNQGNYSLTTKHMAASAIATIAAAGRPWWSFLACLALAAAELLMYSLHPDATMAFASSLILFVAATIAVRAPIVGISLTPPNKWIHEFTSAGMPFWIQLGSMLVIPGVLWLFWWQQDLSESRLMTIIAVLVFSALSYVSARCCGIATAAFPAFGACMAYVIIHSSGSPPYASFVFVSICLAVFAAYLWFVRYATRGIALVTDLALILSVHELIGLRQVSGGDSVLPIQRLIIGEGEWRFATAYLISWMLFALALIFAGWIHLFTRGRIIAHALSDPFLARQNGLNPVLYLISVCVGCLLIALVMQVVLCEQMGSISANIADPQLGIACLLIGYVMASDYPIKGFLWGLVCYVLPEDILPLVFGINLSGEFSKLLVLVPIFLAIYWSPETKQLRS